MPTTKNAVQNHYSKIWGKDWSSTTWTLGPAATLSEKIDVLVFSPRENRNMWTYATSGMSAALNMPLEIHLFSPIQSNSHVELLTVIAYYHLTQKQLNVGHSVNFGRPWLHRSLCSFGLLSLPYLDGPSLEWLNTKEQKIRFLWLIPITEKEMQFKKTYGVEKLESLFEKEHFNYLDPLRSSLI